MLHRALLNLNRRTATPAVIGPPARPRLPPLVMVRAFEAVAEAGSMRKAAGRIHVSHTVISKHIQNLEEWMGTKLLTAGPRGVVLTAEGRLLYAAVSKAFRLIGDACQTLLPLSRRGALRIWCMPGLATSWLSARLQEIEEIVGGVEIILRSVDQVPNMTHAETDLMIAFGNLDEMPENAVVIVRPRMFPVVSPKWLKANFRPETLDELSKCPLIHEDSRKQWTEWFEASGLTLSHPLRGPRLWDAALGLDAVLAGQGIALATRLTASKELEDGDIEELLGTNVQLGAYFLLVRPDRIADPSVNRLIEWLIANIVKSTNI